MKSIKKYFFVTIIIFAIAIFSNSTNAQNNSDSKKPEPKVQRISGLNAKFIVALIDDGLGGAWIGTEDEGVFHCDSNNKISRFTTKNGLGDNNGYALAIDKLGRLWVGHLNTGVSVFNGKDWKNYDVVDGPIGERIFDIKICPKDGDVWIATSAGISRYKIDSDDWEHFTREDGLLEAQASALAFRDDGTLIVGTQCHGLAIFNRNIKGEYKHSKNIVAPDRFGENNISHVPLAGIGTDLPSNLINDIFVTKNSSSKTIWIATSSGLVKSTNDLSTLDYWRGKDYADKVYKLYGGAPKDFKKPQQGLINQLCPEDYLTCLAEDEIGQIWIGTRRNGFMIFDPISGKRKFVSQKNSGLPDIFVTKILPLKDCNYLIATYGGGIVKSSYPFKIVDRKAKKPIIDIKQYSVAAGNFQPLPSPIKSPTVRMLNTMYRQLANLTEQLPEKYAAYYGDDWKTQGDWTGRNYREFAIMCAVYAPFDADIFLSDKYFQVNSFIGPNHAPTDSVRRWVHWLKTDNPKVLWDTYNGYRRQAEWDDHGEAYPFTFDGPDLWYALDIKRDGVFKVGMYFYNKDGHHGNNRFRDYTIEIYNSPRDWGEGPSFGEDGNRRKFSKFSEPIARAEKPLAKCRVRDFWGGVYKQFAVTGPANYLVKIRRNYSFNTIISAVMVDRLHGEPTIFEKFGAPPLQYMDYSPPPIPQCGDDEPIGRLIAGTWYRLNNKYNCAGNFELQRKRRIALYQAAEKFYKEPNEKMTKLAYALKWRLRQWDDEQRKEWNEKTKQGWQKFYDSNETLRESVESERKGIVPKMMREWPR